VNGDLSLNGRMNPVVVDMALKDGHYLGSATIKQREFGITPVSIAGGTVKVKDEVRIEFDIVFAQEARSRPAPRGCSVAFPTHGRVPRQDVCVVGGLRARHG
jgi:hypothetical protein